MYILRVQCSASKGVLHLFGGDPKTHEIAEGIQDNTTGVFNMGGSAARFLLPISASCHIRMVTHYASASLTLNCNVCRGQAPQMRNTLPGAMNNEHKDMDSMCQCHKHINPFESNMECTSNPS